MRILKNYLSFFLLLISASSFAQEEMVDTAMISRIRNEEFNHSQVAVIAHQLTDVSGARLTNSPGYMRAARWAASEMQKWGLANSKLERWGEFGKGWELQKNYVAMRSPYYQPLIAYTQAWSAGTKGPVKAQVVVLSKMDSATIKTESAKLKGKIVLVGEELNHLRSPFTAYATRYTDSQLTHMGDLYYAAPNKAMTDMYTSMVTRIKNTQQYLYQQQPLAIVTKNNNGRDGTLFTNNGTGAYKKDVNPGPPQLVLSTEDYMRLRRLLDDGSTPELEMDISVKFSTTDLSGYNVVAEIPGTDPNLKSEVVMMGGHLDSWHSGTGATDNAAGCIVMMEAVRILKTLGVQPKRTIRIALWSGEEQGLLGSEGYVLNHFGDAQTMQLKPEHEKISAYYNLDNGTGKIRGIFAQSNDQAAAIFQKWIAPFADLGATTVTLKNTGSTDHESFDALGIPGFQFIQDPVEYLTRTHHSNMDTYDHLELDDLKQGAVIVASFVYHTAMRENKIPRKPLPNAGK
jgi:hypothetical protein